MCLACTDENLGMRVYVCVCCLGHSVCVYLLSVCVYASIGAVDG